MENVAGFGFERSCLALEPQFEGNFYVNLEKDNLYRIVQDMHCA